MHTTYSPDEKKTCCTEEICHVADNNENIDASKNILYKSLTWELTAAAYTLCSYLIHTPHPMLLKSCITVGDSCQDPAGSWDALILLVEPCQDIWHREVPTEAQTDRVVSRHLDE